VSVIWNWVVAYPIDMAIAVVLALIAAILIELFKFGWRRFRNLLSPTTIRSIDRQIKEQIEWRRIITNDKALYLAMFRTLFGVILLLCVIGATFILSFVAIDPNTAKVTRMAADWMLIVVGFVCISVMKTAALDNKERLDARVAKIDKKIEELRTKRALLAAK
jgi:cytochrome c biogenesis protein CcdA